MSAKAKGTYYENKLLKELLSLGYEAWKVPLSGALGHNPNVKVPERIKKYLVGDICVSKDGNDEPLEVKFRSSSPFTKANDNVFGMGSTFNKDDCVETQDTIIYYSVSSWLKADRTKLSTYRNTVLTNEMRSWYVDTKTLFLRLKGFKHWIIMELK